MVPDFLSPAPDQASDAGLPVVWPQPTSQPPSCSQGFQREGTDTSPGHLQPSSLPVSQNKIKRPANKHQNKDSNGGTFGYCGFRPDELGMAHTSRVWR